MLTRIAATGGIFGLALTLTACNAGEEDSGIARVDDDQAQSSVAADAGTAEEQALAFAQCMRDNGVDFPDPTVDADGNPTFEGGLGEGGFDPSDTSFRDAMEACGDLMQGLGLGGGGGDFDQEAMTEALYQYTSCLRDEGLDVGDITLDSMMPGGGAGGGEPPAEGEAPAAGEMPALDGDGAGAPPEGERGPGGDPTDRFAEQLGQDADSAEWIAANEACQSQLEDAMGGGMPGAQGTNS